MTEKKKKTIDDLLKEANKREDMVNDYVNSYALSHNDAYKAAIDAVGGKASALKDAEKRKKFVDAAAKFYVDSFKKTFSAKLDGDYKDLVNDDAIFFMSGATKDMLANFVNKHKSKYTVLQHDQLKGQHVKQLTERHSPYILGHINEEHRNMIADITEYKGDRKLLNKEKLQALFDGYRAIKKTKEDLHESVSS